MQKKTLLSACIAIALSGQSWGAEITEGESADSMRRSSQMTCQSEGHARPSTKLKTVPEKCAVVTNNGFSSLLALGATAVLATLAVIELSHDNDHSAHSSFPQPIPPDDNGPLPLPVTSDEDSGIPVKPDNGGNVIPPDNSGDDVDLPRTEPVVFDNNVTWDKDAQTLKIRGATFTYIQNVDGSYTLSAKDGRKTIVTEWENHEETHTAIFSGVSTTGDMEWRYDDEGKLHVTQLASVVSDGTTGRIITVNDAIITDQGGNTALNGGTVMMINGNNIALTNEGKTEAVGEDSVVGILTGDNITINNNGQTVVDAGTAVIVNGDRTILNNTGDSTVNNGGIGAVISGNDVRTDNKGHMTVDGQNSTGSKIVGNNATIIQEGDLYVSNAARGFDVEGNGAIVSNKGNITVVDENSLGVSLSGDASTFINRGDISVSNGSSEANATGMLIEGNHSTLINVGDIIADNFSTGIRIIGDDGQISLAGRVDVGDYSTGLDVSGNNNAMTLAANELNVTGNMATGVNISGDGNNIDITGNILVDKDQTADNAAEHFFDPSVGIRVSGNSNDLMLDGQLTLKVDSELAQHAYGNFSGSQENISGLVVSGDDNSVTLRGGIQLIGEASSMTDGSAPAASRTGYGDIPLIQIDGHSSVYLGGDSVISGEFPVGYTDIIQTSNNAFLEITDDATFSMKDIDVYANYYNNPSEILSASSGSQVINNGFVELWNIGFVGISDTGSVATNNGTVLLEQYDYSSAIDASPEIGNKAFYSSADGTAVNNGTITAKVMEQYSVLNMFNALSLSDPTVFTSGVVSMTGMTAQDNSSALNSVSGVIDMYGRGNVGMLAINHSTVKNAGQITLDTLWVDENDTTTLRTDIGSGNARNYGVGMAVGTDSYDGARKNATAFNQQPGTITIYNAGAGMAAYGTGNTVVNQGTINLEKNENYDDSLGANKLVGMAVYNGGSAVNDQTGIININAENGQAFYNDGSGTIVNYGTICTFGICQASNAYNPTDGVVSLSWRNGDIITADGETLNLSSYGGTTDITATAETLVTNAGTVTGGAVTVADFGRLVNETTGSINEVDIATGGEYTNKGTTKTVSVDGGVFTNEGTVSGQVGTTVAGSVIHNSGSINTVDQWASNFYNTGTVNAWKGSSGSAVMNNQAGGKVEKITFAAASTFNNAGTVNNASVDKGGTFNNLEGSVATVATNALWTGHFNNWGTVEGDMRISTGGDGHTFYNGQSGVINGQILTSNTASKAINDGIINIDKNSNVAMSAHGKAKMINNGTINVGTQGTTRTGMVGMQLESDATADAVIENNGTINIYASNSYAFSKLGSNGHIVNNGTVYIDDSVNGSGLIKQSGTAMEGSGEGGDGTEVHYVDFTAPEEPTITPYDGSHSSSVSRNDGMNNLNGYVVGTNADGSAGKLMVNNASMKGVEINTAFAAGTADKTVSFDDVVQGSNLTDAQAITSTSVVWQATGSTDASGNVDVTMSKNAYTDVATDASVNDVAKALDAGYTNNELYTSLNVGTTAELNSALKQVSGSQATTVFREARVLSNRFSMLADAAPKMGYGLAFNVVAKGDPRAELGNNTEYDMLALRKTLDLSENQTMSLEYGIARLDGDGAQKAGDNGVTGGYSQFFGLKHQMSFDNGMSWNNALRYDIHQLDSSRSVAYGDISKTADTNVKQQYLEFRSEGAKTFEPREGLKITPYAGVKLRHTLEGGYQERNAGDFNLSMNSGSETAVDSIVGLKLDYAGKDGWSANATLEGGPNLSYTKSQRTASLAGAGSQHFNVDDGQKGGGINSLASVGVKYSSKESSLNLDAYHWKEDGISDKGMMLNFKKTF
ncbi:TPA: autotransporter domain-containing protein [Escherichia coli]|nr:autotransporter domain-containing protein [Escherichia coli]HAW2644241.1 autotransporter domain-containing protein [Escherichia coli]HAW2950539.1 autotransporter domain-containing protein [Escherichia coli]